MSSHSIVFTARAARHVEDIRRYIAGRASQRTADRYIDSVLSHLELFKSQPEAGTPRPEVGRGVRSTAHKRRVTIFYRVRGRQVRVLSVLYGGREVRLDD